MENEQLGTNESVNKRHAGTAGFLSLVAPGLGQIYNGQWRKGVLFFLIAFGVVAIAGAANVLHFFWGFVAIAVIQLLLRLYIAIEAARAVKYTQHEPWAHYNKWYWHLLIFVGLIALALLIPRDIVMGIQSFKTPTESQAPTIMIGDVVVADIRYYYRNEPQYGDLAVFVSPVWNSLYTSRIIGLPGDVIRFKGNKLTVNGKLIEQKEISNTKTTLDDFYGNGFQNPYTGKMDSIALIVAEETLPNGKVIRVQYLDNYYPGLSISGNTWVVPQNEVFVTSDNRSNAMDSRHQGYGTIPYNNLKGTMLYILWSDNHDRIGQTLQ